MTTGKPTDISRRQDLLREDERMLPPYAHRDEVPVGGTAWTWSTTGGVWTIRWLNWRMWEVEARPGGYWDLTNAIRLEHEHEPDLAEWWYLPEVVPKLLILLGAIDRPESQLPAVDF